MCARGWCVRRGSLLKDHHHPVKFNDPNFKNEIFVRIDHTSQNYLNFLLLKLLLFAKN